MNTLISMIVPAYQQEKRIGRCLESVLASSYGSFEIVVVNDGSTDKTEEVVRTYMEKAKAQGVMIRLLNLSHGGAARARNAGLRQAKGEFIGFLDADDMAHPQMLERLAESLLKGSDLAACGLKLCNRNGVPALWQYPLKKQHCQCPGAALELVMWDQILMSVCPVLFRREKILDRQGNLLVEFPEELADFEDFVFVCRYLGQCGGFMEVLPFHGVFYCRHAGSLTTEKRTVHELCHAMELLFAIGEQVDDGSFTAHKIQYAFRFMAFWYKEALYCKRKDFSPECESWRICMKELERYADIFLGSGNVSLYKKAAMQIVRKYAGLGRVLSKTIGRVLLAT